MVMEERHFKILSILREKDFVEVNELADTLKVSVETVRRDLNALETLGQLKRVRGGAAAVSGSLAASVPAPTVKSDAPNFTEYAWYSPTREPFKLCGFPFFETDGIYRRYPLNPPTPLPPNVERLAWCPSGGQIRFSAEISKLAIRVKLSRQVAVGYNTTPLANAGFDVYFSDGDGKYTLFDVARFDCKPDSHTDSYERYFEKLPKKKKLDVLINFPIGIGVERVFVGMDQDSVPMAPPPFESDKRILIYGGSIMHGYCTSRPGMTCPNILSRWLNREVVNLGVNGSAKCEREAALSVRMVKNVEWFIISPEGNCPTVEWLREHMTEFLTLYREANPDTKIAVLSYMREGRERFDTVYREERLAKKQCEIEIVNKFREAGDDKIFFWDGEEFSLGDEDIYFNDWSVGDENTVDGQHKSDIGFWMMASGIYRRMKGTK